MGNDRHLARWWWTVPLCAIVAFAALRPSVSDRLDDSTRVPMPDMPSSDSTVPATIPHPTVGGVRLPIVDPADGPPAPSSWGQPGVPVPFGQWWSGLESGTRSPALWAKPLLLRIDGDRADLSVPVLVSRPDGTRDSRVTPAAFFEFGAPPSIVVDDQGPLHVRFTISAPEVDLTVTMIEGSPFLEFEGTGTLTLTIPSLGPLDRRSTFTPLSTAVGRWFLASSEEVDLVADGVELVIDLEPGTRHAIGPLPPGVDELYETAVRAAVAAPLLDTSESLSVAPDGSVQQQLEVLRDGGDDRAGVWSLLPHQIDALVDDEPPLGSISAVNGRSPLVGGRTLTLHYPPVPIVWDAIVPTEIGASASELDQPPEPIELPDALGSYFGAKNAATHALVHDVLASTGSPELGVPHLAAALDSLSMLVTPGGPLELGWEPTWGSVIVLPAEFGAGDQLNDHQLQNGYWVAAAASIVVADPKQQTLLREGIDLLIADYAGASVVPGFEGVVSDEGVWSAFAGHSWAAGIGGFGAGNNLESISESSHSWWAAAKWFLATDRPELAEPFIARLTIESWLTGYDWLPTPDRQSSDPSLRPWTGVVWSGKTDAGTWFSAADEAALGIRLIPVGPQSFSRYPDLEAVRAAEQRWSWCDSQGGGCRELWWNLLDTDAAVAGRVELIEGPDPEPTTTDVVRRWWRQHWETSGVAPGWRCEPGAIVRRRLDGAVVLHASNPSSMPITLGCVGLDGGRAEVTIDPRSSTGVIIES